MDNTFDFYNISQYDSYVIDIGKKDYEKMRKCIAKLNEKYNGEIKKLYQIEKIIQKNLILTIRENSY